MTSVLRQLQAEWNAMVPAAQARRIPRVRILGGGDINRAPLETIAYRQAKVQWLRALLGTSTIAGLEDLSFGIELECILPANHSHSSAATAIREAGVECHAQMYGHSVPNTWKVVTDGSLGNFSKGAEFVSPPLRGEEGFRQLRIVCDVLTRIGAKVNKRCGLHVHVGVGREPAPFFKNLVTLYASAEQALDTVMPPSRRGSANMFCRPVRVNSRDLATAHTVDGVVEAVGQDVGRANVRSSRRYCKLNLQSYFAYGTVEFRHHAGTVEAQKATNWLKLCLRMVLTARAGEKTATTLTDLMDAVGATEDEKQYFESRRVYLNRHVVADNFSQYGSTTHHHYGRME